jgi:deazaflavin-dependent oxidoreductase (nitroreductase family)
LALYHNRFIRWYVSWFMKLALTRPGKWFLSNFTARLDPIVYRMTGGRLNSSGIILFPVLALTTTGRKSGKKRTVQLAYVGFDDSAYLVASNFGKDHHPAWMHNIEADPRVSVQLGSNHYDVTAEKLTAAERALVWDNLIEEVPNFGLYEQHSGRTLRVFRLPMPGIEATAVRSSAGSR